jgi:hypothetical protein
MTSTSNYWNPSASNSSNFSTDWGSAVNWKPGSSTAGGSTGGKMAFDPTSLASAGIGAIGGIITGFGQQRTAANIANAQMAAQADALKQGILFQRDSAKANIGLGMFGQIFGATTEADLDFGRQAQAKRMEFAEFTPKQMGLDREQATWETAFKGGPLYRDTARKERIGRLQETIAAARAQPTGMFGRIAQAPIESLMV